jgi:hypothetical protein
MMRLVSRVFFHHILCVDGFEFPFIQLVDAAKDSDFLLARALVEQFDAKLDAQDPSNGATALHWGMMTLISSWTDINTFHNVR